MQRIKNILLFLSLLFVTLYIPLSYTIYSSNWYEINYNFQDTYEVFGVNQTNLLTNDLIGYFEHKNELSNTLWSEKEKAHFEDVRAIYDVLFVLFFASLISIGLLFNKERVFRYSKINIIVILSLLIVLPFFGYFWNYVFHPLLFSNDFWIMSPNDVSYYLFGIVDNGFFVRSFVFIIVIGILENLFSYYLCKKD